MNRVRSFTMGVMLLFALSAAAQQTTTSPDTHGGVPTVADHLKMLAVKLDLTADQQGKIKPVLQELHDGTQKLMDDQNLSRDQRQANVMLLWQKSDKEVREVLNEDQQKKLDDLEKESHMELHGDRSGSTPASAASPQH